MIYYTYNTILIGFHSPGIPKNKHSSFQGICNITYCSLKAHIYFQVISSDELSGLQPHKVKVSIYFNAEANHRTLVPFKCSDIQLSKHQRKASDETKRYNCHQHFRSDQNKCPFEDKNNGEGLQLQFCNLRTSY